VLEPSGNANPRRLTGVTPVILHVVVSPEATKTPRVLDPGLEEGELRFGPK